MDKISDSKLRCKFNEFDEKKKGFLTNKQFKLAFISLFGEKVPYPFYLKNCKKHSNHINYESFTEIIIKYEQNLDFDQIATMEFKCLADDYDELIYKKDFTKLFDNIDLKALNQNFINEIFELLDCDEDGKISFSDYLNFKKHVCLA